MRRAELEHVVAAAAQITDEEEFVVVGGAGRPPATHQPEISRTESPGLSERPAANGESSMLMRADFSNLGGRHCT
jgi:hypothetical protein